MSHRRSRADTGVPSGTPPTITAAATISTTLGRSPRASAARPMRPRIVQRINDFSVTEELVAAGVGIALLPRYSTDDRGGRRLARRPVAGVRAARVVEAVLRTSTAQRPAVAAVLDALRAEAASLIRTRA